MAMYCVSRQIHFSQLFALRETARTLYGKVQEESRVPELERELEKVRTKWSMLVKEHATRIANTKKARKLKVDLTEKVKTMA